MSSKSGRHSKVSMGIAPSPFSFLLMLAILCSVFSPAVTFVSLHLDQHLEVGHYHSSDEEAYQASCTLHEMMAESAVLITEHAMPISYSLFGVFIQNFYTKFSTAYSLESGLKYPAFSHLQYQSPHFGLLTPPPRR